MPTFWFDKAAEKARYLKGFLSEKKALTPLKIRSKKQEIKQIRKEIKSKSQEYERIRSEIDSKRQESERIRSEIYAAKNPAERSEHERREKRVRQEISQLRNELQATKESDRAERFERKRRKKTAQQEILRLERELHAAKEAPATTGALPDFVVIGGKKCGTTYLYHLLSQHPLVEPAASKELHYFDALYEQEDTEWYRRCFPTPRWKDGHRTITGEGTPYMAHILAPERMAKVVPQARLIALLRNPVDRAYSDCQMVARKGREPRSFEEAIGLEQVRSSGKEEEAPEGRRRSSAGVLKEDSEYLSRSVYVDQLLRWSRFFGQEQMLVLKSEDFFERPQQTLEIVFGFLGLPEWEPEVSKILPKRRNKGDYEEGMDPSTRRRLEEYFEPHNRRLYDFLGKDLGW